MSLMPSMLHICVCVCVCVLLNHVRLCATPQTVAHQAPLSVRFYRQEYGVRSSFLLQGIFLMQGSN